MPPKKAAAKTKPKAEAKPAPQVAPAPLKPIKVKGKTVNKPEAKPVEKTAAGFARAELMMPNSQTAVLNNLIAREEQNPSGPVEPISDTVTTLVKLAESMSKGGDISPIKTDIVRIVAHQPEKADVFQSVLNLINQERVADAVFIRALVEKILKRAVQRGDLTTAECLAVWEIANNTIQSHEAKAAKQNKQVDSTVVVEKVDAQVLEVERLTQQKWEGTTPQGRQIIRMKLFDLKRHVLMEKNPEPEEEQELAPAIDVK